MRSTLLALSSLTAAAALAAPAPAATDADTTAADAGVQRCVGTYAPTGKYGTKYCVDTEGSCTVSVYNTTAMGTSYYCLVRA